MYYAATQFALISVFSKFGDTSTVGLFSLVLAYVSPTFIFFNLKLRSVLATDVNNEYSFEFYSKMRTFTSICSLIVIVVIVTTLENNSVIIYGTLLGISKYFEMKSEIIYGYLQRNGEFNKIALSIFFRGSLILGSVLIIFYLSQNLYLTIFTMIIVNLLIFYLFDKKTINVYEDNISNKEFKEILKLSKKLLPLGFSALLGSLIVNLPRMIIEKNIGIHELGIFSGISYVMVSGNTIVASISQIYIPRLAYFYNNNSFRDFIKLTVKMCLSGVFIGITILIIAIIFGEELLGIIYNEDFKSYQDIFVVLSIGSLLLFSTVFVGSSLMAIKKYNIHPIINIISLLTVLIFSLIFVNKYGLIGIAWSIVIANTVSFFGYTFALYYFLISKFRGVKQKNETTY
jgi:O-antigen/teichoic acid export membrane protein